VALTPGETGWHGSAMSQSPVLHSLGEIAAERARLDARELDLIDTARRQGATWVQVADVLGLGTRQAAEQRRRRLAAAVAREARARDARYGAPIENLRRAVADLHRVIQADPRWTERFTRATLVRDTVAAATEAEPGPLFALAAQAADDLSRADLRRTPRTARAAADAFRQAVRSTVR
jgi:hypothetical protein